MTDSTAGGTYNAGMCSAPSAWLPLETFAPFGPSLELNLF